MENTDFHMSMPFRQVEKAVILLKNSFTPAENTVLIMEKTVILLRNPSAERKKPLRSTQLRAQFNEQCNNDKHLSRELS